MKVSHVHITLQELQEALADYCVKHGVEPAPDLVTITSFGKSITVDLAPGGVVDADAFRHEA